MRRERCGGAHRVCETMRNDTIRYFIPLLKALICRELVASGSFRAFGNFRDALSFCETFRWICWSCVQLVRDSVPLRIPECFGYVFSFWAKLHYAAGLLIHYGQFEKNFNSVSPISRGFRFERMEFSYMHLFSQSELNRLISVLIIYSEFVEYAFSGFRHLCGQKMPRWKEVCPRRSLPRRPFSAAFCLWEIDPLSDARARWKGLKWLCLFRSDAPCEYLCVCDAFTIVLRQTASGNNQWTT